MATKFKQNLDVTGNISLSGTITAQGNVTLGDADTDSVTFTADVTSHILPDLTGTYDLGADGKAWRNVHAGSLIFEGSNVDGNETTFGVVNPTADRTINLPDSTGTVATEEWVAGQGYGSGAGGSINGLNDVDTATSAPTSGQVLKWNGANWTPANDTQSSYTDASVNAHLNQSTATSNQVLSWSGTDYAWVTNGAGSMSNVVEDTSPQLGGNLDLNSKDVTGTGNLNITGNITLGSGNLTTTGKLLFANVYSAEADLPNATTYHGMFAHVHATGAGYFAHAGNWIKLANDSQLSSYQTTAGLNGAIDTHLNQSNPTSGHVLSWNGSDYAWVANSGGGGSTNPAGSNTQVQYNNNGSFGAESDFTYNASTNTLSVVNLTATSITTTGAGSQTITAGANIELNAVNRVLITDTPFRLASFTTTQRNALASPVNGDMIYNSTTNQLESYENSAWVATKGSVYSNSDVDTHLNQSNPTSGYVLSWNGSDYAWVANSGSGLSNVVDDTTPQLGGNLDINGKKITSVSGGDIDIEPNGTGDVLLGNFKFDADQTVGAGQDNYVMTYDNSTGKISLEANAGGGSLNTAGNTGTGSVALASETLTVTGTTGQINVEAASFALSFSLDQNINSITSIAFEGATANTNETKLQAVDPTADNTIELPNKSGTIGLIGDTNTHTFVLGANGSSDYTFSDANNHWFPTTENDPVLYLRRGETYIFTNNSGGSHPFQIRQSNGGVAYNTGVTSNGASSGNITFKVPMSAPATLYYQCTVHSGMGNTINIV